MIVAKIICEPVTQVDDPMRFKVEVIGDGVDKVEIKMNVSDEEFIDISDKRSIVFMYSTAGEKEITARINETIEVKKTILCLSAQSDRLFSSDDDLLAIEEEIAIMIPDGRLTFNNKHRQAQKKIIEELNSRGIRDKDGNEITKENIAITKELNAWSRYLVLHLIYFDRTTEIDGIYSLKADHYLKLANAASKDRQFITIDKNKDGNGERESISYPFSGGIVVR